MSIPTSAITATAAGLICDAGSDPPTRPSPGHRPGGATTRPPFAICRRCARTGKAPRVSAYRGLIRRKCVEGRTMHGVSTPGRALRFVRGSSVRRRGAECGPVANDDGVGYRPMQPRVLGVISSCAWSQTVTTRLGTVRTSSNVRGVAPKDQVPPAWRSDRSGVNAVCWMRTCRLGCLTSSDCHNAAAS